MLEINHVHKTFFPGTVNERVALDGVDLTLAEGDFVSIIGSNGAGTVSYTHLTLPTNREV